MDATEALRELLLERRPEKAPISMLVPAQLPLHRPAVRLLLGEEVLQRDWGPAGLRFPGEGLVVGDDARDLRTRTHEVEDLKGHEEPLVPPVEEVEVEVHLLNQGGVERLGRVVGGQGLSTRPPTGNGLAPGVLGVGDGGRRVALNGLHVVGRDGLRACPAIEPEAERLLHVVQGRQGLVPDGPVQPRLPRDEGAPMLGQGPVGARRC